MRVGYFPINAAPLSQASYRSLAFRAQNACLSAIELFCCQQAAARLEGQFPYVDAPALQAIIREDLTAFLPHLPSGRVTVRVAETPEMAAQNRPNDDGRGERETVVFPAFQEEGDARFRAMPLFSRLAASEELSLSWQVHIAMSLEKTVSGLPALLNHLSPHRMVHVFGVRQMAVYLAAVHRLPLWKASLAALLHDCGKGYDLPTLVDLAEQTDVRADAETLANANLLHGPVAAGLARTRLGVNDPDILAAIARHTAGAAAMAPLAQCVFLADAVEMGRSPYPLLADIRALAERDLRAAMLMSIRSTEAYLLQKGETLATATRQCRDWLLAEPPQISTTTPERNQTLWQKIKRYPLPKSCMTEKHRTSSPSTSGT